MAGKIIGPWSQGPTFLVEPTLADLYDRAMGNEPMVGMVGTVDIHFGMMGHGAFFNGGDRDIALTRSVVGGTTLTDEGSSGTCPNRCRVLPASRPTRTRFRASSRTSRPWTRPTARRTGSGATTPSTNSSRASTPRHARPISSAWWRTVVKNEDFGQDETPDLLYLNFKEIDFVSHVWSMNSPEMEDAVVAQDAALKELVTFLNKEVGKGEWVLGLTADHAAMPDPAVTGGFQISSGPMQVMINEKFDTDGDDLPIVELMQPTQAFLDLNELKQNGYTVDDVARYMMTFTQAQTAGGGVVPNPGQDNDTVMQAVFPSALMPDLPCLPEARE